MKNKHRRFHHYFWYIAAPLLIVFLLYNQPGNQNDLGNGNQIPDQSKIGILP